MLITSFAGLVLGPPLFGLMVAWSGSYVPGFLTMAAACLAGAALLIRRRSDAAAVEYPDRFMKLFTRRLNIPVC